ncbi:MAG TPA: PIG-L family deacetylase [Candidatus Sulfotelmatobacter sp.]|nr:PIG-L family deacetylase [Candidatus Sulfotelmatobacter sp.]
MRNRFAGVDVVLERFASLGVCELPPAGFPEGRRRILVIEPHMDDAALSLAGTMWLRRNECEFTVLTLAGVSNFTSYYEVDREFFDVSEVTALRKAESALFLRHIGGHHRTLDLLEAPLRYRNGRWTLEWFRQHRDAMWALVARSPGSGELEQWTAALARFCTSFEAEEIWMPLGVGGHVDHQLAREACLQVLSKPGIIAARKCRFYEEVPYTVHWSAHAAQVMRVLQDAGAQLEPQYVDIGEAMTEKLRLLSIFGSQFKMDFIKPAVERAPTEALHELLAAPSKGIDPISCYPDGPGAFELARSITPWMRRHESADVLKLVVLPPFGRWEQDMRLLMEVFPKARIEVFMPRGRIVETETLSSPRVKVVPVDSGRWYSAALPLLFSRPSPLVIIVTPGREGYARWLKRLCFGSDSIVAPSPNSFFLALRSTSSS